MISKFINRVAELNILEKEWKNLPSFVVISGRRRIGKTRLLEEFSRDKKTLFFTFPETIKPLQIKEFLEKASKTLNDRWLLKLNTYNWYDIFDYISDRIKGEMCIILDEFSYAIKSDRKILSDLQRVWDHKFSKSDIMLIISGSLLGMMKDDVLSHTSPLYGRRSRDILLGELSFFDSTKFFKSFDLGVEMYLLLGGVPEYLKVASKYSNPKDFLLNEFMSKTGYFYREPYYILSQELKELKTYFSIISAIALGNSKAEEIASWVGIEARKIYPYLETLMRLGFVERLTPITVTRRVGIYKIRDNMLNTWFNFVYQNREEIEMERPTLDDNFLKTFQGNIFEKVAREFLIEELGSKFQKIGKWWYGDKEIDIIAINDKTKEIYFFEIKWKKLGIRDTKTILNHLREKSRFVEWNKDERREYYGIIAKSIREKEMFREKGYICYDLRDFEKLANI